MGSQRLNRAENFGSGESKSHVAGLARNAEWTSLNGMAESLGDLAGSRGWGAATPSASQGLGRGLAGAARSNGFAIQPKMVVGAVGDKYEQEADAVAAQVVEQINTPRPVQRNGMEEDKLQMKPVLRREALLQEDELQMKPLVQFGGREGGEVSAGVEAELNSTRGTGQVLDEGLQRSMGEAMGADFSGVRLHTDARADRLSRSLAARAFTTGRDVFFRQGEYQPRSLEGQELIAHELTHVVQQKGNVTEVKSKDLASQDRKATIQHPPSLSAER